MILLLRLSHYYDNYLRQLKEQATLCERGRREMAVLVYVRLGHGSMKGKLAEGVGHLVVVFFPARGSTWRAYTVLISLW